MEQAKWSVSDAEFKLAEKMLRDYASNKRKLEEMVKDIQLSTPVFDDNGGGRANIPSNPTERTVFKILNDARISYLNTWINAIEKTFTQLDAEKQRFVRLAYWECNSDVSWKEQAVRCSLTYPTLNRWRKAIILKLCEEVGAR